MSKLRIRLHVLNKDVANDIEDAIDRGIKVAVGDISQRDIEVAQARIRHEEAIFSGELMESFTWFVRRRGKRTTLYVENTSDHAEPIEIGAQYTNRGPPVEALIPWVEAKLKGWVVENNRLVPKTGGGDDSRRSEPYPNPPEPFNGNNLLDDVDSDTEQRILDVVDAVGQRGDLQLLGSLNDEPGLTNSEGKGTIAQARTLTNFLGDLDSTHIDFNSDSLTDTWVQDNFDRGFIAGNGIEHVVRHELTHTMHYIALDIEEVGALEWPSYVDDALLQRIEDEISLYARANPKEFVAEVGALLLDDQTIPTDLFNLYIDLFGPDMS